MTLPTPQVLLDDGTGTFPFDITSRVLVGPGFSFERGRQDWQGGVTAGSLSLTLNNSDGRFTPGSTIIASPSPIKVDARIRVKETINGVTLTRFTGYVKQWPVAWPATVSTFASVQLVATDAQARAERRVLRSVIEEEILADSPSAYYMLSEPSEAVSAADSSGSQAPVLTAAGSGAAVVFGSAAGPATDGLPAAQFSAGQYLASGQTVALNSSSTATFVCAFSTTGAAQILLGDIANPILALDGSGHVGTGLSGGALSVAACNDGAIHVAELVVNGATTTLYVDGVAASGGTGSLTAPFSVGVSFVGTIAHVAQFGSAVSLARAAAHSSSMLTGFAGESGTARLTRLAGYAGLPIGTLDTSLTNVAFVDFTGATAWVALQQATDAEMGVTFIDGSGSTTFHNRNRVAAKTSPDLTLQASALTGDPQVFTDDQQIINYFDTTSTQTGVTQTVRNTTSETSHGRYSTSADYLVQTDQEALDRANWIVTNFAEPTTRYGTLTINLYGMTAAQAQSVLSAVEIDCWLRIQAMPSQNTGGTTVDLVVEGYTETVTDNTWTLTCNVVNRSLFNTGIYDNATFGAYDSAVARYGV